MNIFNTIPEKRTAIDRATLSKLKEFESYSLISASKIINKINELEDSGRENELKSLLGQNYNSFISKLKSGASDVKTVAAIKSGLEDGVHKDDVMTVSRMSISVKKLIPTQNEIDASKSLFYPLTDSTTANSCLSGSNVVLIDPIITFRGRFVIDGHHRWSQVYAINSGATIVSNDLQLGTADPIKVLAAVQMAIAAKVGNVPVQTVSGTNLFSASRSSIINYVKSTITPNILMMFKSYGVSDTLEGIADHIWNNVVVMKSTSRPVSGAPGRGVMPQTDSAPGWDQLLKLGRINWNNPY